MAAVLGTASCVAPLRGRSAAAETADLTAAWVAYAGRFLSAEGRLRDDGQDYMSHSEGQGTALLIAARVDDRQSFDVIWAWTRDELGRRDDRLHAWGWHPSHKPRVGDLNNATDGDLLIAWALVEAWRRWRRAPYRTAAIQLATAIRDTLARPAAFGPVLLPGAVGFEFEEGLVVNLSYGVLPAYRALQSVAPDPVWQQLARSHGLLLEHARFGPFSLPPDWLFVPHGWRPGAAGPAPIPWPDKPARFGFDAIRIPLYLAWAGLDGRALWPFLQFWEFFDRLAYLPSWISLSGVTVSPEASPPGFGSIRRLAKAAQAPGQTNPLPDWSKPDPNYYSASLTLMSLLAWTDRGF
jgi:endoglucanase